jgi:hypothetical protein
MLSEEDKRQLDEEGYLVLEDLMSIEMLRTLRARVDELFAEEGDQAGSEFKQEPNARRLANLVNKGEIFQRAIENPRVIECMAHVLGLQLRLRAASARRQRRRRRRPRILGLQFSLDAGRFHGAERRHSSGAGIA